MNYEGNKQSGFDNVCKTRTLYIFNSYQVFLSLTVNAKKTLEIQTYLVNKNASHEISVNILHVCVLINLITVCPEAGIAEEITRYDTYN